MQQQSDNIAHKIFITGTDTGVGKTFATCTLLRGLRAQEKTVAALKPVAAGCDFVDGIWCNDDALALQQAAGNTQKYHEINPVALRASIAPHLAAHDEARRLSCAELVERCQPALQRQAQFTLIEGAGGFCVPLSDQESMADLAAALTTDIVLVVGMRLGCLNHALLTAQAIHARGLRLRGWLANSISSEPMTRHRDNLATLRGLLPAPCLGEIPWGGLDLAGEKELAKALICLLEQA